MANRSKSQVSLIMGLLGFFSGAFIGAFLRFADSFQSENEQRNCGQARRLSAIRTTGEGPLRRIGSSVAPQRSVGDYQLNRDAYPLMNRKLFEQLPVVHSNRVRAKTKLPCDRRVRVAQANEPGDLLLPFAQLKPLCQRGPARRHEQFRQTGFARRSFHSGVAPRMVELTRAFQKNLAIW